MIWMYPAAAFALVALSGPVVVHILARHRARRVSFPTLRFIEARALASMRRRALEDVALLFLRIGIVLMAVAAAAGPFLVTAARQRAWDARTIRVDVADTDVRQGLVRATSWLAKQPPGRREIVVRGGLPIGSVTDADIASVAPNIGIRFERTGALPETRTLRASAVLTSGRAVEREMMLNGARTSVRDTGQQERDAAIPIEIAAQGGQQASVIRLREALARERIPAPLPGRRARVVFGFSGTSNRSISSPWIADAAARAARDISNDGAINSDDIEFGADGNVLMVGSKLGPDDARALLLLRVVARSLAAAPDRPADEIVGIPDAQLRAWSRSPAPAAPPDRDMIARDDRRWAWAIVLVLVAFETWVRRKADDRVESAREPSRAA